MRLDKKDWNQLKLIRLAEKISKNGYCAQYIYRPYCSTLIHEIIVFNANNKIVIDEEYSEPASCYEAAIKACKEKGVLD